MTTRTTTDPTPLPPGWVARGPAGLLAPGVARLALLCSRRAPASLLLRAHDLARAWRQGGPVLVGGYQSLVEREVLDTLLAGDRPLVYVRARPFPARWRPRSDLRPAWEAGRLLVAAPERGGGWGRGASLARNRTAVALAGRVLVIHADPDGATESLAREALAQGVPVYTLAGDWNAGLLAAGARAWEE